MARFFDNLDEENPPATGTLDATNTSKKLASAPASQLEDTFGDNDGLVGYNSRSPMAVAQDEAARLQRSQAAQKAPMSADRAQDATGESLDPVRLAQRASPMLKLLKHCVADPSDMVWGV